MTTPSSFEDQIATKVHQSYDALPAKFKPTRDANGLRNWVPLSGIVLTNGKDVIDVVAIATGMKCLPAAQMKHLDGGVLHDSHAEVLAIRLFNHFLLSECYRLTSGGDSYESPYLCCRQEPIDTMPASSHHWQPFAIRDHWRIWMYCSEAPCGDASMELVMASQDDATPWIERQAGPGEGSNNLSEPIVRETMNEHRTSTGSLESLAEQVLEGRGYFSKIGRVRRKPGRADSPLTLSKSCSDKLALKQCLSLLSSTTSLLVAPSNAYIHTLLLPASQYHASACERAFGRSGRMEKAQRTATIGDYSFRPFGVRTTACEFRFSRRASATAESAATGNFAAKGSKASNIAAVHSPYLSEVLIGGLLQGYRRGVTTVPASAPTTHLQQPASILASASAREAHQSSSASRTAATCSPKCAEHRGASGLSRRRMWRLAAEAIAATNAVAPGLMGYLPTALESVKRYSELKSSELFETRSRVKSTAIDASLQGWAKNEQDDFPL